MANTRAEPCSDRFRPWMWKEFAVEMEKIYADAVYAMQSEDAEWWERSAAQGWLRFMEIGAAILAACQLRDDPVLQNNLRI